MVNRIQPNNHLVNSNQNNCCTTVCNKLKVTIRAIGRFIRKLFLSIFCCYKKQNSTNNTIENNRPPRIPFRGGHIERGNLVPLSPEAVQAAANLRLSQYGKTTCPPPPQNERNPEVDAIPINELLTHYDRLFPEGYYDRLLPVGQHEQVSRENVRELIDFVNNRRRDDTHRFPEYTAGIQLGIRYLLAEMRKPEIHDDTKRGVFLAITSFTREAGCHPRRYEDIYGQVDHMRNSGADLRSNVIFWNATDKEDVVSRCCRRRGVSLSVVMHHINKARRDMGREWGLKQDPATLRDPYIEQYARSSSVEDFRESLETNYSPGYMIHQTKERLSLPNNRQLFVAELGNQLGDDLPEDFGRFYEQDGITPSYAGVTFILQGMGFLEPQ